MSCHPVPLAGAYEARAAGDGIRLLVEDELIDVEVVMDLLS